MKHFKGWIFDAGLAAIAVVILAIIMVLFAAMWIQYRTGIDNQITNSTTPLNATAIAQINGLGNSFFLSNGQDIVLIFWLALVVALFISAAFENATFFTIPIGVICMVGVIFTSFVASDLAHSVLAQPALSTIVGTYYSGILYLTDNLPIISGVLCVVYLLLVVMSKGRLSSAGGGGPSANIVSG